MNWLWWIYYNEVVVTDISYIIPAIIVITMPNTHTNTSFDRYSNRKENKAKPHTPCKWPSVLLLIATFAQVPTTTKWTTILCVLLALQLNRTAYPLYPYHISRIIKARKRSRLNGMAWKRDENKLKKQQPPV